MRNAITTLSQALFGRVWDNEIERTIHWLGFYRGAMLGIIAGTLIQVFA